jgi:hypothetical protein
MIETLGAALQRLKQEIAANVDTPIVLTQETLELQFHGLSLSQLVVLTEAPVLAAVGRLRPADGPPVERFAVDGRNQQQREMLVRRLVLDPTALQTGPVREVVELQGGTPCRVLVRDLNGVVYRIMDGQALVEKELTAALQRDRRPVVDDKPEAGPLGRRPPVVISDPLGFYGAAGEILHGLSAVHMHNQIPLRALARLAEATGERDAKAALAAAGPDLLGDAFRDIEVAARRIEGLVNALNLRMTALLRIVERAESAHDPRLQQPQGDDGPDHPAAAAGQR